MHVIKWLVVSLLILAALTTCQMPLRSESVMEYVSWHK